MNILLINHYAGSSRHGMEYRPYYLGREWVRLGHRLTVVAASFSHVRSREVRCDEPFREEQIEGIRYVWLRTPAYSGNGLGRARNMGAFVYRLFSHRAPVVGTSPPDVVIASSTYPLDIYPAWAIARRWHAALVHEIHDLWPLSPMELGGMPWWHPFILALQRAEDFACRHAHRIVSILPRADAHLRERGMAEGKYFHVPNGVCVEEWEGQGCLLPQLHADAIGRGRAAGRFLVGYTGAHGEANALHVIVEAAQRLRGAPVLFLLVGQGPEKARLEAEARRRRLDNLTLLPPIPKSCVPAFLAAAGALYLGLKRQPLFRFGIGPNKLFDYMMAGKPVIQAIDAGNDMVAESGCGLSVPAENPDAVAGAVRAMMHMPAQQRAAMGARGREYVLRRHDYQVLASRFLEILEHAVAERRHAPPRRRAA